MHTSLYPANIDMLVLCVCGLRVRVQFASPVQLPLCNDTWMMTAEFQGESGYSLGGGELALCLLVNAQDSGYLKTNTEPYPDTRTSGVLSLDLVPGTRRMK